MQKSAKLILAGVLAFFVIGGAFVAWTVSLLTSHPDFEKLRSSVSIPIKLADETKTTRLFGPNAPSWTPMRQISNHLLMAVIASEDTSFFSHQGVDYHELREALKKDLEEKRWARGASTLTQQVVKNAFLSQEKTLSRKVREILWARQLDKALSKSEVLCFYVNMAEWGPGIYGIRDAARHYFQKSPAGLTPKESAFLAILLPSPVRYHSYFVRKELTPWAAGRVEHVLHVMNSMGFLDDAEYAGAQSESLWGIAENGPATGGSEEGSDDVAVTPNPSAPADAAPDMPASAPAPAEPASPPE